MESECIFCKIIAGNAPAHKIYEDEQVVAFLDVKPINPGHALVATKEHYPNIYETPDEVIKDLAVVTKNIAIAVKKAVNADGTNFHVNNDPAAGQVVFHTHIHVIPRYEGDGYTLWHGKGEYEEGEAQKMAEAISAAIT